MALAPKHAPLAPRAALIVSPLKPTISRATIATIRSASPSTRAANTMFITFIFLRRLLLACGEAAYYSIYRSWLSKVNANSPPNDYITDAEGRHSARHKGSHQMTSDAPTTILIVLGGDSPLSSTASPTAARSRSVRCRDRREASSPLCRGTGTYSSHI